LLGFLYNAGNWAKVMKNTSYSINYKDAIASSGLSTFGKYMPGKVWVILGRAEYLANKYQLPRKDLSSFSLNTQFISLWTGMLLGAVGMITIKGFDIYGSSVLGLFILLSLIIYTSIFHNVAKFIVYKITKKQITIPKLSFMAVVKVLPLFLLNWGLWCLSFYLLAAGLLNHEVTFNVAWGFALAGSLGVLAVIAPGGLGVREGVLTGYLTLTGLNLPEATTIAVTSRLWFLIGEVFIFLVGITLNYKKRLNNELY